MYKDDIWYRRFEQAVEERRELFTDKQWAKYGIPHLLRVANRVRELSDSCETCRGYQYTLTRLEEELQELPGSKAQRQYQTEQLREIGTHFVEAHRLAPPKFFLRKGLRYGAIGGLALGFLGVVLTGYLLLFPLIAVTGFGLAALYGYTQDQKFERDHRLI